MMADILFLEGCCYCYLAYIQAAASFSHSHSTIFNTTYVCTYTIGMAEQTCAAGNVSVITQIYGTTLVFRCAVVTNIVLLAHEQPLQ